MSTGRTGYTVHQYSEDMKSVQQVEWTAVEANQFINNGTCTACSIETRQEPPFIPLPMTCMLRQMLKCQRINIYIGKDR